MNNKHGKKISLLKWLGFKRYPDLSRAPWLGSIIGMLLILIALVLFLSATLTLFAFVQAGFKVGPYSDDPDASSIRNVGLVLAAFIGAPFVIWRATVAARQVEIADESLFNDKVDSAAMALTSRRETTRIIEQDGLEVVLREWEDDLVARSAAIDRLESLASERNNIAPRIARMLATYVRGNFRCENLAPSASLTARVIPRMDLQQAIDAIGRVYELAAVIDASNWRLDLRGCNFDGVNFSDGYFRAADFTRSRFEASVFDRGNFAGCRFYGALLNYSDFRGANFEGARLDHIILNQPQPVPGGFVTSINLASLKGATFVASDISALDHIGTIREISEIFVTNDTVTSSAVRRDMLPPDEHRRAHLCRNVSDTANLSEEDKERIRALEATGFQNWSPYSSTDLATSHLLEKFFKELDLNRWPSIG